MCPHLKISFLPQSYLFPSPAWPPVAFSYSYCVSTHHPDMGGSVWALSHFPSYWMDQNLHVDFWLQKALRSSEFLASFPTMQSEILESFFSNYINVDFQTLKCYPLLLLFWLLFHFLSLFWFLLFLTRLREERICVRFLHWWIPGTKNCVKPQ